MDCLIGMQEIPSGSVDLVICDLPYGTTANKWDSIIPLDKLWAQYKRIIKRGAPIVLFAQQPFTTILAASNIEWLKYEWIWEKENGSNFLMAKYCPLKIHENILVFYESKPTYNPQMRQGFEPYKHRDKGSNANYGKIKGGVLSKSNGERFPVDIIAYNRDSESWHPTQKPLALIKYLILTYSNPGDTVLDNCMGSGTTAVAAIRTGRNWIGYEMNTEFYNRALKRIDETMRTPTLF